MTLKLKSNKTYKPGADWLGEYILLELYCLNT